MANSVEDQHSESWRGYPDNLQHLDISDTLPHKKETIAHAKKILCSNDESYTELLEFGVRLRDDDEPPEIDVDSSAPVTLQIVPLATGEDGKKGRMSITADELQALLHDFQAEPNLLNLFYEALNLGSKAHFGPDGETKRIEIWFSLPFPDDSEGKTNLGAPNCVVWFDYVPDTHKTRILLFRPSSDLLSKLRHLEAESREDIRHGYQIILFLYNRAIAKWFGHSQFSEILLMITTLNADDPFTAADKFFHSISTLDDHLLQQRRQISMLTSMITLTEFLQASSRAFGVEEDRHHKAVFEEHIRVQTHRLRLLAATLNQVKGRLLDKKASMLCRPPVANTIAVRETRDLLIALVPKLLDTTNALATDIHGGVNVLANVVKFYLPWITVASIFGALSITGSERGGLTSRFKQYFAVAGPLVGLTFASWQLPQYTMSLYYGTKRLFTSMRDSTIRFFSRRQSPRVASDGPQETAEAEEIDEFTTGVLSGLSTADRRNLVRNIAISRARASMGTDTAREPRQNEANDSRQDGEDEGDELRDLLVTLLNQAAVEEAAAEE